MAAFSKSVLNIDPQKTIHSITKAIYAIVRTDLRKRGVVLGVSGGIDSSVCAALCAKALGPERILAILMPERDSDPSSLELARSVSRALGISDLIEDITPILEAAGCYRRQADAIHMVFPEFREGWKQKITIPSILESNRLNISRLTVWSPSGELKSERMMPVAYQQLVAATNFKQRIRKMIEYYHADRLNYAVCGTPNRLEFDQGFFVKQGDGAADFKPIAHLYKTQVYAIAPALGIPEEICKRVPTTDTFSLSQTQEEFYFALPFDKMDLCLYALNHSVPSNVVAEELAITAEQVERIYRDIESKRRGTASLHSQPILVSPVPEIHHKMPRGVERKEE